MRRQFIPDPQGTSLMFAFFAQHFTHQFFKTDTKRGPAFTLAKGHGVSTVDIDCPVIVIVLQFEKNPYIYDIIFFLFRWI